LPPHDFPPTPSKKPYARTVFTFAGSSAGVNHSDALFLWLATCRLVRVPACRAGSRANGAGPSPSFEQVGVTSLR
jgi:hypothetical protein